MRLTRVLRRRRWDDERARELESYLAEETADNIARGMSPDAARAAAHRRLGNATRIREEIYEMNSLGFVETLWHDLRYGARVLRRNPTFALVTILTLALGTGANTAMFQLIEAIALRPLPVERPQELLELKILNAKHGRTGSFNGSRPSFSNPVWERIRAEQQVFSGVLAWTSTTWDLAASGESRPVQGIYVSGDYFSTLGVPARLGRVFTAEDDRPGCAAGGAVLSDAFWKREYGGERSAIGRPIVLDGHRFDIVGVTPPSFFGTEVGRAFDVALPLCTDPVFNTARQRLARSDYWLLGVFGRLKPGVTPERAAAQLRTISAGIFRDTTPPNYAAATAKDYQTFEIGTLPAASGYSSLRANYEQSLTILLVLTGIVLLIACANLANLMLARATAREREIAVRLAIGASRRRIVRQLVSESLLIALAGAAAGLLAASWFSHALVAFLNTGNAPLAVDLALNARVFGFTTVVATAAALVFGLVPALRATRVAPNATIKASSRSVTDSRFGLRRVLVVAQVALSLVMVVGALLFVRSLWKLTHLDPGFRQDGVMLAGIDYSTAHVPAAQRHEFDRRIAERLRAIPGVDGVARVFGAPLGGNFWNNHIVAGGAEQQVNVNFNSVTSGYFRLLGTPLVAGRDFDEHDTAQSPRVAVVTEAFVRQFFPHGDALGHTFQVAEDPGVARPPIAIVGVVKDSKYGDLREPFTPLVYVNGDQDTEFDDSPRFMLHASTAMSGVTTATTRALVDLNGSIVVNYQSLRSLVDATLTRDRLMATLSGFFGLLAVLIATVGLYGVMAYTVARRRVEIGIRMALGADRTAVVRMVAREAAVLLACGTVLGLAVALPGARTASALLYGLQPTDLPTLASSVTLLACVTLLASCIPAWRASRIAPTVALREE